MPTETEKLRATIEERLKALCAELGLRDGSDVRLLVDVALDIYGEEKFSDGYGCGTNWNAQ